MIVIQALLIWNADISKRRNCYHYPARVSDFLNMKHQGM